MTDVLILLEEDYDHSPLILKSYQDDSRKNPFRFFQYVVPAHSVHGNCATCLAAEYYGK